MKTASQILAENNISVASLRDGNSKTKCPRCSHTRRHKSDKCLSVRIDRDGVMFRCHNCDFHGGEFFEQRERNDRQQPNGNATYARLHRQASAEWR